MALGQPRTTLVAADFAVAAARHLIHSMTDSVAAAEISESVY